MRIVIDINHPAHVHFFKNFIWKMQEKGHVITITATEKDLNLKLLDSYNFKYLSLGSYGNNIFKKIVSVPYIDLKMYTAIKKFRPDLLLGFGSIRAAHVSKMLGKPSIIFDDDEYSYPYYAPFASAICGFSGFKKSGKKILHLNSFKELAYLHPNYFKPVKKIENYNEYALVRFVSWKAFHDVGKKGFDAASKDQLIKTLSKYTNILISSEGQLPAEYEGYKIKSSINQIHNIIANANLLICDSQTMTTEAGVLGTPAIRCNSFVGKDDMGNFIELENKYNLIYNYQNHSQAITKAVELLQKQNLKEEWKLKRDKLLKDKIDVTAFMLWFIENYPKSFQRMKNDSIVNHGENI